MKKVLSLVLALSLVLSTFAFTPAFAASVDDVAGEACEDAVNVLVDLGIVSGYEDGTYKPENIVTRAEMAVLIINALALDKYIADQKSSFTDMDGYGWAEPYIAYAQSLGFINGYGDGTFKPGNTVSYDEAATMLVGALGYTADALVGTWPANYVTKAKSLGIMDDITASVGGANRGDIAIMLFNTLDESIGYVDKDGNFQENYDKDYNSDNMITRLGGNVKNGGEPFVLTHVHADDAAINVSEYLGAYVEAYVNSDDEIIAISAVKSVFLTGEFDGADTFVVDDVEYDVVGDVSTTAAGIYSFVNGAVVATEWVYGGDAEYTIAADVSGKKIKEVYSVADWSVIDHDYFAETDALDIEEDHELFGYAFKENDDKEINYSKFALIGAESLEAIPEDAVVYVYTYGGDPTEPISAVVVGTEVVEGEVTKVNKDLDEFTVDGVVYALADQTAGGFSLPVAGDEVAFTLDGYGDIYDIDSLGTKDYAVVVRTANGTTGLGGEDAQIELILADGTCKVFDLDDSIAGFVSTTGGTITVSNLSAQDIIKFHVDKDGVIDEIEEPGVTSIATSAALSITAKGTYDGKTLASDLAVFTYDGVDATDYENYGVASYDSILGSDDVAAKYIYDSTDKVIVAMLITDYSISDDVFGIFTGYANVNGEDYDWTVDVLIDGKVVTLDATTAGKDLAAGTYDDVDAVYILDYDAAGAVKGGFLLSGNLGSDYAATNVAITASSSAIDGNILTVAGTDYNLDKNVVVYKWNADDDAYEAGRVRDLNNAASGAAIYLYSVNGDDKGVYDIAVVAYPAI